MKVEDGRIKPVKGFPHDQRASVAVCNNARSAKIISKRNVGLRSSWRSVTSRVNRSSGQTSEVAPGLFRRFACRRERRYWHGTRPFGFRPGGVEIRCWSSRFLPQKCGTYGRQHRLRADVPLGPSTAGLDDTRDAHGHQLGHCPFVCEAGGEWRASVVQRRCCE